MPITFRCEGCQKDVTAPDAAAGKRGRCPFCGHLNAIPHLVDEDDDTVAGNDGGRDVVLPGAQ